MKLFIVESPGKVKTIQSFLGADFRVHASIGHCFTIEPTNNGIDIENNFKPKYVVIDKKDKVVNEIKSLSNKADIIYLAMDSDREGSAIAALLACYVIKDSSKIKRVTFHEITKTAVLKGIENAFDLKEEENLFNAQQARSVLDMLVGYKVSPVLWSKVRSKTSAGRVQSIGLRFIVERQREIDKFVKKEYWTITGMFKAPQDVTLKALYHNETEIPNETISTQLVDALRPITDWYVDSIVKTTKAKTPYPLFNTSSLQQFASSSFGWDGKHTMSLAQKLYDSGFITYHRTDSLVISKEAVTTVRQLITTDFGAKYCPSVPREFKSKNKVAQEAHEGIRPTHLDQYAKLQDLLDEATSKLGASSQEFKLFEAIYCRFLACQMSDAQMFVSKITIKSKSTKHEFVANGQIIKFDGYLKVWRKFSSTKDEELPALNEKDKVKLDEIIPEQHFTKPPAAYNTASLIKVLEEEGIGRPSTYAGILDNLEKKTYIEKDGKAFKPTELGGLICDFLVANFPELMDVKYTARIEEQLDDIANGKQIWHEAVGAFYTEMKKRIDAARGADSLKVAETTDIDCPTCKKNKLVKRKGKYGEFYGCAGYGKKGKFACSAMFKIGENKEPVTIVKKELRYLEGVICECGSKVAIRVSKRTGKEFGGCSAFPKCRKMYDMNGTKIEFDKK